MARRDGRKSDQLREVSFVRGFTRQAPGSVLVRMGNTQVLCTATVEHNVPKWMEGKGKGWVTAEYAMVPGSTPKGRKKRERGKIDGRSAEIQRLIGRALRAVVDFEILGERTIWVDCDVLEADGGTRTASITGAWVALYDAIENMKKEGIPFAAEPLMGKVSAISVGIVDRHCALDLDYREDSRASVDLNVVMTDDDRIIEVQGTAEGAPFSREKLDELLNLATKGIRDLLELQAEAVNEGN